MVILAHAQFVYGTIGTPSFVLSKNLGELGVSMFFAMSGFLITTLLMREHRKTGAISLKQFYIRRVFRALPALYVFMLVAAVVTWRLHVLPPLSDWIVGLVFLKNYIPGTWTLGHLWSLSMEEQFYFLWPPLLALAGPQRASRVAIAIVVLAVPIRLGSYVLWPSTRDITFYMLHTRIDSVMCGVAAAMLLPNPRFQSWLDRGRQMRLPLIFALYLGLIHPFLIERFLGKYLLTAGWAVEAWGTTLFMLWAMDPSPHPIRNFLNWGPIVQLGTMSYSIYLYQQLFLNLERPFLPLGAALIAIFVAGPLSYYLVERPGLQLRTRFLPASSQPQKSVNP